MDACFSCFSRSGRGTQDDHETLLPKRRAEPSLSEPPPDESLHKLTDVLVALSAGKLPSQAQINHFLRRVLQLNLLQVGQAKEGITPDISRGNGPLSKKGRKVIHDLEEVMQAILRFGMEKNDDNLLQDLFSQLYQMDTEECPISLEASSGGSSKTEAMKKRAGNVKDGLKKQAPNRSEISADAKEMLNAFKTLGMTFLTSSVFRLILVDAISIGQELVAHAASDVAGAALQVHDIAEKVEERTGEARLSTSLQEGGSMKGQAAKVVEEGKAAASSVAHNVQQTMKEKQQEWEGHAVETEEEMKRRLIIRIQEVVNRAQESPPSRRAILAILQIIRKYAHKFTAACQEATASVQDAAEKLTGGCSSDKPRAKQNRATSTPAPQEIPIKFFKTSYPPKPYGPPPSKVLIPGIKIDDPHLQYFLEDAKRMMERIAQGHQLNDLVSTLGDVIKDTITTPQDLGRAMERLTHEKPLSPPSSESAESASIRTEKHTEHTEYSTDDPSGESSDSSDGEEKQDQGNLLVMYISSVGRYLDKAMSQPGWVTSRRGKRGLETLYDATQDLLHLAGDVVIEVEEAMKEDIEQTGGLRDEAEAEHEHEQEDQAREEEDGEGTDGDSRDSKTWEKVDKGKGIQRSPTTEGGTTTTKSKAKENFRQVIHQWVEDITKLLKQVGNYVDAVEGDRTTMKLINNLEVLREDVAELFNAGKHNANTATSATGTSSTKQRTQRYAERAKSTLATYTQWLSWSLPRLLWLLPLEAIPVPRIEFRTDDAEGAVDALWIRGMACRADIFGGGRGGDGGGTAAQANGLGAGRAGVAGKLIPDEILLRHWTEVKVTMPEGAGVGGIGAEDAQMRMGLQAEGGRRSESTIEATSRLRVKMDGIKACVHGMGYYYRYSGALFTYEDEGLLGVDLGTSPSSGGKNPGLSIDVELEVDNSDIEMDLSDTLIIGTSGVELPLLVIEDVDDTGSTTSESDIDPDAPQNFDVQEAISEAVHTATTIRVHEHTSISKQHPGPGSTTAKVPIEVVLAHTTPLFKVLTVAISLSNLKFRFEKSKHWIINKLLVQPFALNSILGKVARGVLEEKVKRFLEAVGRGAGVILGEAQRRAFDRREITVQSGIECRSGVDWVYVEEEEGEGMKLSDLYAALLDRGPEIFAYYGGSGPELCKPGRVEVDSGRIVYMQKGQQPVASGGMVIRPHGGGEDEGNSEDEYIGDEDEIGYSVSKGTEEDVMIANAGPQLFPGKGGPHYGAPGRGEGSDVNVSAIVRERVDMGIGRAKQAYGYLEQEEKVNKKGWEREVKAGDWRSLAFDF
ncbi:hypothetical protein P691DRAFT_763456 [Macrolepiota fuliginosa MF-IS2]|uniref:HAM1-like N-terminal domain-containing protein n=1 Tax=Macrolepiota fuliginosa MF-IS2 TaxID=1400762 RepID=A0A9P5X4K0_9AGAR|nr:hypothetical protein P691DRAFT_763456 [Macrolepiota fuliginosa MF-IS2]